MNIGNSDLKVTLAHGSGGRKMHRLIKEMFLKYFSNPVLARLGDSAEITKPKNRIAFTTDGYVVQPIFFPGGDIGKLAVCGTINDLAVSGASPKYLAVSFIIQEGFPFVHLEKICQSMAKTAKEAKVKIVAGDTKVIENREAQTGQQKNGAEIYIITTGIGIYPPFMKDYSLGVEKIKPNDLVLINGGIGEHETAIILAREEFEFKAEVKSDCAPLNQLISDLLLICPRIRFMRDPTRGGLATTLNEIVESTNLGIIIDEQAIIIKPAVKGICELLGFDPLYLANEGKVVIITARTEGEKLLARMRKDKLGKEAKIIGEVVKKPKGVWVRTKLGSLRPLLMLEGQQFPRIC
uniref:Hydrogenase expression/formation protein HypE n=1 Tax=candidate division WOR-3 bacterium TaxID=2052148 RepID=A0A7C6E9P4_UNCW3